MRQDLSCSHCAALQMCRCSKHKKTLSFTTRVVKLAQVAQRDCGISIHGDIKNSTGHSPGQSAPADLAQSQRVG